jgi:predicted anti-sigma-YlaC factor YlaD
MALNQMDQDVRGEKQMITDAFTEKLSLWLDNELSPAEVTELKSHLESCPACRQTHQAMQQVHTLFLSAAATLAAPSPGFAHRLELRLAQRRAVKGWQIWLAVAGLLLGPLFFIGGLAVVGGLSLLNLSSAWLDAGIFYQWLTEFIDSATSLRVLLNLAGLLLKAAYVTIQEPLFWVCVLVALVMMALWVRVMHTISQRSISTAEFIF